MANRTPLIIVGVGVLALAALLIFFARSGEPPPLDASPGLAGSARAVPASAPPDAEPAPLAQQAPKPLDAPARARAPVADIASAPGNPVSPSPDAGAPKGVDRGPAHAKAPVADPGSAPDAHASLDKDEIQKVIQSLKPQMTDCYAQALAREPSLHGQVTVEFTLERDVIMGSVPAEGSIVGSTMNAPLVEACMLDKLRDAKFPEMKGEGTVKIRYPFRFANPAPDAG